MTPKNCRYEGAFARHTHSTYSVETRQWAFYETRRMPKLQQPVTVFGRRLREARERVGLPQDKLGVKIGLDEGTASARISRYETGVHQPPFETAEKIAKVLKVPVAYLYCPDDELAWLIIQWSGMIKSERKWLSAAIEGR